MKIIVCVLFTLIPFLGLSQKSIALQLNRFMESKAAVDDFSGAVLVAKNNKIVYSSAFGMANRELKVANSIDTKFRIGSVTKQFTAAAILQLIENKQLSLQDKLNQFFPNYPHGDSITIHMLLNHTSGIKNYTNLPSFPGLSSLPLAKDSIIALFRNQALDFTPGSKWNYSNSGYFLLGCIVEKVGKQSFESYLNNHFFKFAALKNTSMDKLDSILPNRANGYTRDGKKWTNAPYISMEFPFSAGAMISTVNDLFLWNKALHKGNILRESTRKLMTTAYLGQYGYGVFVNEFEGKSRIGHTGGIPGFISQNDYYPTEDLHIIVLANFNAKSQEIANALAQIMFSQAKLSKVIDKRHNKERPLTKKGI